MWDPWGGIALIICAVTLMRYVTARSKSGPVDNGRVQGLEERMAEVEKRLSDIQEIVLAIDEKLERQEERAGATR